MHVSGTMIDESCQQDAVALEPATIASNAYANLGTLAGADSCHTASAATPSSGPPLEIANVSAKYAGTVCSDERGQSSW